MDEREGKMVVDEVGHPHPFDPDYCKDGCQPVAVCHYCRAVLVRDAHTKAMVDASGAYQCASATGDIGYHVPEALFLERGRDRHVIIEPIPTCVGDLRILTVGRLRELLDGVEDYTHVVLASSSWYDNVGEVVLPGSDPEQAEHAAVTLFPSARVDSRQF